MLEKMKIDLNQKDKMPEMNLNIFFPCYGSVGAIAGPSGSIRVRWGHSGADGPKGTFHRS